MRVRACIATLVLAAFIAAVSTGGGASAADPACTTWTMKTLKSNLGSLENLEFDGTGGMLLSASGPGAIERLMPDGTLSTLVPDVKSPGGQRVVNRTLYFNTGDAAQSGLAGTPDGTLERFDLDTGARTTFASGLTMPNGLAILPNGDFVVSRDIGSGTGITRVPAGDPGHPQANWAAIDDQNGMAVDPTGTWLYADQTFTADSAVYRIRIADPSDKSVVATLAGPTPKGLDDMTIDPKGVLYLAANGTGEVIRLDPVTKDHCTIATGLQNPSSLKFGRGPGWPADRLYVTSFDGTVRELTPPPGTASTPPVRDRIALSVKPRSAIAGRRTRFHFTVYRVHKGKRTRLAGAKVRLAGKSATTGRRGRAALAIRFKHAGKKPARATKSGLKPARKTVVVRSRANAARAVRPKLPATFSGGGGGSPVQFKLNKKGKAKSAFFAFTCKNVDGIGSAHTDKNHKPMGRVKDGKITITYLAKTGGKVGTVKATLHATFTSKTHAKGTTSISGGNCKSPPKGKFSADAK
jgi:sugar lactone lactonase YvrE